MISERIKELLDKLNLSQRQFALKINVDPGYLSRIIQGKVIPSHRILLVIENVFYVNKTWLEKGEGKIFAYEGNSLAKQKVLDSIDRLTESELNAVAAFIRYLKEFKEENPT